MEWSETPNAQQIMRDHPDLMKARFDELSAQSPEQAEIFEQRAAMDQKYAGFLSGQYDEMVQSFTDIRDHLDSKGLSQEEGVGMLQQWKQPWIDIVMGIKDDLQQEETKLRQQLQGAKLPFRSREIRQLLNKFNEYLGLQKARKIGERTMQMTPEEVGKYSPRIAQSMRDMGLAHIEEDEFKEKFREQLTHRVATALDKQVSQKEEACREIWARFQQSLSSLPVRQSNASDVAYNIKQFVLAKKWDDDTSDVAQIFGDFCVRRATRHQLANSFDRVKNNFNQYIDKQAAKNEMVPNIFIKNAARKIVAQDVHPYDKYHDDAEENTEYNDAWDIVYAIYKATGDDKRSQGARLGSHKFSSGAMSLCAAKGKGDYVIEGRDLRDGTLWGKWTVAVNDSGLVTRYQKWFDHEAEKGLGVKND